MLIANNAPHAAPGEPAGANLVDDDPDRCRARLLAARTPAEIAALYALPARPGPVVGRAGGTTRDLQGRLLSGAEAGARLAWSRWDRERREQLARSVDNWIRAGLVGATFNDVTMALPATERPKFDRTVTVLPDGRERIAIGAHSSIEAPAGSFTGNRRRPARPTAIPASPAQRHARSEAAKRRHRARLAAQQRRCTSTAPTLSPAQRSAAIRQRHAARLQAKDAAARRTLRTGGYHVLG
jgi:hypothetical protein